MTISLIVPVYDEVALVERHLQEIVRRFTFLDRTGGFEVIVVDDGSTDGTAALARRVAAQAPNLRVISHARNRGLGAALRSGFGASTSRYAVTLDLDLSYSLDVVPRLIDAIERSGAALVLASPYAAGGRVTRVPFGRKLLSAVANRYLGLAVRGRWATLTGMVRAYDMAFVRSVELRSDGPEINIEAVCLALERAERIEEIPAHLEWTRGSRRRGARRGVPPGETARRILRVLRYGPRLFAATRTPGGRALEPRT